MISAIGINDVLLSAMSESEDVIIRTVSFNEPSEKIANRMRGDHFKKIQYDERYVSENIGSIS
jgi:hypothetical protein